jgi:predicted ATPase/DNA-binding SARP family transcriptional activator
MSRLSVSLLGPFRAAIDGHALTGFRSDKVRALLAYLVVESDTPHRRERLAGLLWPDYPERTARAHLRVALTNLRQVIGDHEAMPPFLLVSRQTIQFNSASDASIDIEDAMPLLRASQPTIELLEEAVGLYRGEFMAGFSLPDSPPFEEWALLTREQVHRLAVEALHHLARSLEQRGEYERALAHAWRQVDLDPWRETAHRQVMRLLALSGQRSAALAQYRYCRQMLRDELGVEVSEETRQLYEKLEREESLPGGPTLLPRHNLPAQTTSFEGREAELAEIDQLLSNPSCRLLTLVGPGGIGKTRLALEAAGRRATSYRDEVYFVPLAHVPSPEFVVPSVASVLRFTPDTTTSDLDPLTQLLDYLGERAVLLVMDSFEHLVEGSSVLADILEHAPNVRLLVTSRERLGLRGEWVKEVQGMKYPANGHEGSIEAFGALKLFLARARQSDSGFVLSAAVRPHVQRICRLVEGMPLGIELAAAWVPVLSCQEIASEIQQGMDILTMPHRGLPDRHRSVRAAFDHSWKLLTEEAKAGFRKLSVFRGGLSRQAAAEVAGADLGLLSELVTKSLLRRNAQGRYEIHELLRQYASEQLDALPEEKGEVEERHSRFFVRFLSARESGIFGERLREIKHEIRAELQNVEAAVLWAAAHRSEAEARDALAHLNAFYLVQGWFEGKSAFARLVQDLQAAQGSEKDEDAPDGVPVLTAMAYQAMYGSLLGDVEAAEEILQRCLPSFRALGVSRELAASYFARGVTTFYRGDFDRSQESFAQCIAVARASQAEQWVAHGLMWLGWVVCELADYAAAEARYEESYAIYKEQGSLWGMAFVLSKLGLAADAQHDCARARRYHEEALQILARTGDRAGKAYTMSRLSLTAYNEGKYVEAHEVGRRGYELFEELGHRWGMGASLCRIGFAALGLGRRSEARNCFDQARELAGSMQHIPLMLYSLTGIASLLAVEGQETEAVDLLAFVEQHPQTPATYLDIAGRWFSDMETRVPPGGAGSGQGEGWRNQTRSVYGGVLEGLSSP